VYDRPLSRVDQFDSITKRIGDIDAMIGFQIVVDHLDTGTAQMLNKSAQIADKQSGMCLCCRMKVVVDSQMNLYVFVFKPRATPDGKVGRVGLFGQPKNFSVKLPRIVFPAGGYAKLTVIDS